MKTQHTPGPWLAEEDSYDWKVVSPDYGTVARRACYPDPDVDTRVEADARLIAASPDLLEALEGYMMHCKPNTVEGDEAYCMARKALSKVKGEA